MNQFVRCVFTVQEKLFGSINVISKLIYIKFRLLFSSNTSIIFSANGMSPYPNTFMVTRGSEVIRSKEAINLILICDPFHKKVTMQGYTFPPISIDSPHTKVVTWVYGTEIHNEKSVSRNGLHTIIHLNV